ncbi:hypothetical protein NADE_006849 [Nannochloris sp. 'desiccata']|nr:hypothetical protein NADE_006849 [Chlorella desiccata (nom. nud.)]
MAVWAPENIPSAAQRCWAAQLQRAFSLFGVVISLEEPCELHVNQECRRWKQWYLSGIQNVDESRTKIYKYVQWEWNQLAKEDRVCKQCAEKEIKTVETAEHLFFHCPSYDDIRADFPCLDFTIPNLHEFSMQQPTQITRFGKKRFELHQELNPLSRR